MSAWILIIIQLLPSILELIQSIMEAIRNRPQPERAAYRREFIGVLRKHVRRPKGRKPVLRTSESAVVNDLEDLLQKIG